MMTPLWMTVPGDADCTAPQQFERSHQQWFKRRHALDPKQAVARGIGGVIRP